MDPARRSGEVGRLNVVGSGSGGEGKRGAAVPAGPQQQRGKPDVAAIETPRTTARPYLMLAAPPPTKDRMMITTHWDTPCVDGKGHQVGRYIRWSGRGTAVDTDAQHLRAMADRVPAGQVFFGAADSGDRFFTVMPLYLNDDAPLLFAVAHIDPHRREFGLNTLTPDELQAFWQASSIADPRDGEQRRGCLALPFVSASCSATRALNATSSLIEQMRTSGLAPDDRIVHTPAALALIGRHRLV